MYYGELESLRYGNVLVKAFDGDHRLVGVGLYFGRGKGKIYLQEEIDSSEDKEALTEAIAKACSEQRKIKVVWELQEEPQEQPNASEG